MINACESDTLARARLDRNEMRYRIKIHGAIKPRDRYFPGTLYKLFNQFGIDLFVEENGEIYVCFPKSLA